ncbi:glycine cleavage system protein R [Thalassotalea insulae]|uniref:Glycine cleavage system transcriptional repressor n=1 Tax=Thalassotalea insulae TaxID=2056778 RepID=A0ABQ6GX77_9GAMM|nr:ACT domain-containing protein [Thalassotalea insulae]GLX79340.1 glycine cleavage system protein R [Thalassotalea insulae]
MNHLIISFISPDRPGLVDTLANIISQHQGNWQTSSLHYLSGYFSGVMEIAVASEQSEQLIDKLQSIPDFKCLVETANTKATETDANIILELTANDRTGIVQEISSVIHHQGGNLLKLVSSHDSAPHSGQTLFKAKATIAVAGNSVEKLVDALESLADDLMVDISH